jgi:threonine/homoserine/homoserine lactone efflux protein
MKIKCPSYGSQEFSLIQKFEATIAQPLVCSSCNQRCVRSFGLSIFALFIMIFVQQVIGDYFWLNAFLALVIVILGFLLFELEPLSEQAIRNNAKRLAIIIRLAIMFVLVMLGGLFLFGKVFLP